MCLYEYCVVHPLGNVAIQIFNHIFKRMDLQF